MSFEPFALHARVLSGVRAVGYTDPTPIQTQAIPHVMAGRDVLGLAQTGTGKTAAFALPILDRIARNPKRGVTRALVVAPTRELAEQIHQSFADLGQATGIRSATVYGGVGMNPQIQALRRGTEVIVACPGRLLDLLSQGYGDLSQIETLVLDEADHMFDMGFLPDIRKILAQLPRERQSLLFSATMPGAVRHLVDETLRDPVTVAVDRIAPAQTVSHALYPVGAHLKTDLLLELLKRWDARRVLVFTRTKHRAKRLAEKLDGRGLFVASLQGNLSQRKRQEALDGFKRGDVHVLVATDIAARGIDVALVSHVVNYDVPDTEEAYVHRIGRTGRARAEGDAVTFVTPDDGDMVRRIEKTLGERIERVTIEDFNYDVPAPARLDADERRFERGGVAGGVLLGAEVVAPVDRPAGDDAGRGVLGRVGGVLRPAQRDQRPQILGGQRAVEAGGHLLHRDVEDVL
ncbi:MAG: DEAD/DEAH box helicase, partial [Trueperaceae bacterium]|nr:DEAD/DEAH box helicase [Trueperaceae bacterium]